MGAIQPVHQPRRIVSLAPSVTSILLALGVCKELVGVTKWCKDVADVSSRPEVGDCWKLDIREVARLKPTLLIGSVPFAPQTVAAILEQPIPFLALNPRSLRDVEADIGLLASLMGREKRGAALIRKMHSGLTQVRQRGRLLSGSTKPRVYCEAWPHPRISSPPWVSELVDIAGGRAAVRAGKRVTDAEVARARPDVIVLAWAATGDRARPEQVLRNPAWNDVPAVKSGRVAVIPDQFLNTPAPVLVQGAQALLRAIHADSVSRGALR